MLPSSPNPKPNPAILHQQQVLQQQHLRRRRRARRSRDSARSPQRRSRARLGRAAAWLGVIAVVFWIVVIATHVEWVRQHDGSSIHPMSYYLPVVVSVLAAGFVLLASLERQADPGATLGPARRLEEGGDTTGFVHRDQESARSGAPSLVVIAGSFSDRRIQLSEEYMIVGRDPTCDVQFDDSQVSRIHAGLRRRDNAVYVQDLASSGGTFVNGTTIDGLRELHSGDIVAFASVKARFVPAGAVTDETSAMPAEPAEIASSRYHIGQQNGEIISNVGHDQHNSYVQQVIQQRESFLREIAATKTKARWLVWTGFIAFVAGFALFAAGVLRFLERAGNAVQTGGGPTTPFGPSIGGVASGLLGWALAAIGMLLLVIGIVLHIVATSRRKRIDRELPVPPPWPGAGPAGRMT
jgi:hypothetical protein